MLINATKKVKNMHARRNPNLSVTATAYSQLSPSITSATFLSPTVASRRGLLSPSPPPSPNLPSLIPRHGRKQQPSGHSRLVKRILIGTIGITILVWLVIRQIYAHQSRSLDYDVVSTLVQLAAAPSSLAKTIRLMVGHELATEGFRAGQVGSSAMPHKMNTRSSERVNGFAVILRGYASMTGELAGDQWNEGDVSCSVVRRVALPDAFFALDGLLETFLTVLDGFGAYPAVIARELDRYLPFLATTKVLMALVRAGVGRETAHEAIKEHAVAVALAMREQGQERNDLLDRLAADERIPLDRAALDALLADRLSFTGVAGAQVASVVKRVGEVVDRFGDAAKYSPAAIL